MARRWSGGGLLIGRLLAILLRWAKRLVKRLDPVHHGPLGAALQVVHTADIGGQYMGGSAPFQMVEFTLAQLFGKRRLQQ